MSLQILNYGCKRELEEWNRIWSKWKDREVHAHPEYVNLFCGSAGQAVALYMGTDKGGILYPIILRDISEELWARSDDNLFDVISPYGYGGAYCWGDGRQLSREFWQGVEGWAKDNSIVSSFVRLSLFPEQRLEHKGIVTCPYDNIVRSLHVTREELWYEYKHAIRKNVKRARSAGVQIVTDECGEHIEDFINIYFETMRRVDASRDYFFDRDFFDKLLRSLHGSYMFFHAFLDEKLISTELVLVSARNLYSFLGGTDLDYSKYRPNNLLKHEIINWGLRNGKDYYVLGGGFEKDDGIFKYKRAFAPDGQRGFFVCKTIYDAHVADRLVLEREQWEQKRGRDWCPSAHFFPPYRG